MEQTKLHRAIAAALAAAITLGLFSAVVSIGAEDQARLAATRSAQVQVASKAPDTAAR